MTSQRASESQTVCADLPLLHAQLGFYARQLWDIQKVRIMTSNRLEQIKREQGPPLGVVIEVYDTLGQEEKALNRELERLAKQHPLAPWIREQRGIGLPGFARLMGITGPLSRFPNVAKLWAYLGMHVANGQAPKRTKGQKANWSPQGRVLCHQIADSIVKSGKGTWREIYDYKKAQYVDEKPDWTPAHRHNAAMRYAIKELLKAMWVEWQVRVPANV